MSMKVLTKIEVNGCLCVYICVRACVSAFPDDICAMGPKVLEGLALNTV